MQHGAMIFQPSAEILAVSKAAKRGDLKKSQPTPHKNTSTMMHHMALSAINRQ
jgi:hypothetical protein